MAETFATVSTLPFEMVFSLIALRTLLLTKIFPSAFAFRVVKTLSVISTILALPSLSKCENFISLPSYLRH
jgi:hypothetical protein